jgi:hypothetical protein
MQPHAHTGADLGTISLVFDLILLTVGIVMAMAASKIPNVGAIGKTVRNVVIGAIILGIAHLVETGLTTFMKIDGEINEIIHRVIILAGFAFLYIGIKGLADSLNKMRANAGTR